jgi:hypothetical protein
MRMGIIMGYGDIIKVKNIFDADLVKINEYTFFHSIRIHERALEIQSDNPIRKNITENELINALELDHFEAVTLNYNLPKVAYNAIVNANVEEYQTTIQIYGREREMYYSLKVKRDGTLYINEVE